MILLGIETATELVGVAVADATGPRAVAWATGHRRHVESVAPLITQVLGQAEIGLHDVETIVVDTGPGLFTGLRVGIATAKGFAQGLGIGIIGLSGLEVLARAASEIGWTGPVLSVIDARRGEVFAAAFREGRVELEPTLLSPAGLADQAKRLVTEHGAALAVGNGALRYAHLCGDLEGLTLAGSSFAAPPPGLLVTLAAERLAAGQKPEDPMAVEATYLREADVAINWAQRQPPTDPPEPEQIR